MAYQRFNGTRTPEGSLLVSAASTFGANAEELGIDTSMRHVKTLPATMGNILTEFGQWNTNVSTFKDNDGVEQQYHYGGYCGFANVNLDGQGTLSSRIPCVVIHARKRNAQQRGDVRESFAQLGKKLKGAEKLEINVGRIDLYESRTTDENGLPSNRLVVLQANGLFGSVAGKDVYWSVMQHPSVREESSEEEEAPKTTKRNRRPRNQASSTTPPDDMPGGMEGEGMGG